MGQKAGGQAGCPGGEISPVSWECVRAWADIRGVGGEVDGRRWEIFHYIRDL